MTNELDGRIDSLLERAERNAAIIAKIMSTVPVGNIREHTPDSMPDRVAHYVEGYVKYHEALETIADGTSHAKEVAQRALGWLDNEHYHIELLREENLKLKLQLERLQKQLVADLLQQNDIDEDEAAEGHD